MNENPMCSATAVTASGCECYVLNKPTFDKLLKTSLEAARAEKEGKIADQEAAEKFLLDKYEVLDRIIGGHWEGGGGGQFQQQKASWIGSGHPPIPYLQVPKELFRASRAIREDKECVIAAVSRNVYALEHALAGLGTDQDVGLAAVRAPSEGDDDAFQHLPLQLRSDRVVAKEAVALNGLALYHVGKELKADIEVVRAAVKNNGYAMLYADKSLKASLPCVLKAVERDGDALSYAAPHLQGDRDAVLKAVAQSGLALQHASAQFRADRDVVLAAVAQNGDALQYASEYLQADLDVARKAAAAAGPSARLATGPTRYARCDPFVDLEY